MEIINKMIKQRKLAAKTYEVAKRVDLADKELLEAKLLSYYLPTQLSDIQLTAEIDSIIIITKAKTLRDMSKVMSILREKFNGKCDMQLASNLVKTKLSIK